MQRQEAHSAISIASPHRPLLVVKHVLERLEDTAWLLVIKWLWDGMTSRKCSSETRLMTHGFVIFGVSLKSFVAFSKEVWSILPGPYTPCLSQLSDTSLPPSVFCTQKSVIFPATSAFPEHFIMLRHTQS